MQRADSLGKKKTLMLGKIEGKRKRRQQRMRWLYSIADPRDMNLSKLWEIVKDKVAWYAAVHAVTKSQTQLSDQTTTKVVKYMTWHSQTPEHQPTASYEGQLFLLWRHFPPPPSSLSLWVFLLQEVFPDPIFSLDLSFHSIYHTVLDDLTSVFSSSLMLSPCLPNSKVQ